MCVERVPVLYLFVFVRLPPENGKEPYYKRNILSGASGWNGEWRNLGLSTSVCKLSITKIESFLSNGLKTYLLVIYK